MKPWEQFRKTDKYREQQRKRYAELTPEKKLCRNYRAKYNMTYEEVSELLSSQGDICAACGVGVELGKYKGVVDHCHSSGKVRGILCHECNLTVGVSREDINRLEKLADYLRNYNE